MADLLGRTERIRVFPDVANLPLRGAAMIAKQAASLDVLSGGRFELGLGSGAFWEAVRAMGGPVRSGREALQSLEEAIAVIRAFWSGERTITVEGEHYSVKGLHPGPAPVHPIAIWLGVGKPRGLELTGRLADGWVPSSGWLPPERLPEMNERIDEAAEAAGRKPDAIRRIYNVAGTITDGSRGDFLEGPASYWVDELSRLTVEFGMDAFVLWPAAEPTAQVRRFAEEVAPGVRAAVADQRKS
jgi:alkanesulfonate monooxygenase SsuD/methylene tetrahydromethanopterin reductase-like flavin-dependent oxidoreductase (luciferase family)